ncbi:MAG: hypothetical protein ABIA08_01475 [bacterium]
MNKEQTNWLKDIIRCTIDFRLLFEMVEKAEKEKDENKTNILKSAEQRIDEKLKILFAAGQSLELSSDYIRKVTLKTVELFKKGETPEEIMDKVLEEKIQ